MEEKNTNPEQNTEVPELDIKFKDFIIALREMYDTVDSDDEESLTEFAENEAQVFGAQAGLSQEKITKLTDAIKRDYQKNRKEEVERATKKKNGKKKGEWINERVGVYTKEKIKENIKANVDSAIKNYIKFVLPYSEEMRGEDYDPAVYEAEIALFKSFQSSYLTEEAGLAHPKDIEYGFEELKKIVLENEEEHRQGVKQWIIREQRENAKKYIDEAFDFLSKGDLNEDQEKKFWTGFEIKMRLGLNMCNLDKDKVVLAVKKFTKEKLGSEGEGTEKIAPKKDGSDAVVQSREELDNARQVHARISLTAEDAARKIEEGGLSVESIPTDETEEMKGDLEKMQSRFREVYRDALEKQGVENIEEQVKKEDVNQGVESFNAKTNAMAEKRGFGKVFSRIVDVAKNVIKKNKKKAMTLLVVGVLAFPAALQKDTAPVTKAPEAPPQTEAAVQVEAPPQIDLSKNTIPAEHIIPSFQEEGSSQEKAQVDESVVKELDENDTENVRVTTDTFIVESGGSIEKSLAEGLQKHAEQIAQECGNADFDINDVKSIEKWSQDQAHLLAEKCRAKNPGIDIDQVKPGTKVYLDLSSASDISIDIAFEDGPSIVPEKEKKINEIVYIKEQMKKPEFQKAVAKNIKNVFALDEDLDSLKKVAQKKVMEVMESEDNAVKERLTKIMTNAHEAFEDVGMPRENASVQNYFIRLYARAKKEDKIEQIFA